MELALTVYILTFLIPINGLLLLAVRNERRHNRVLLRQMWRFRRR